MAFGGCQVVYAYNGTLLVLRKAYNINFGVDISAFDYAYNTFFVGYLDSPTGLFGHSWSLDLLLSSSKYQYIRCWLSIIGGILRLSCIGIYWNEL